MRILLNNNHTPHLDMLLRAMPDQVFHITGWNSYFRDFRANARTITKGDAAKQAWDLVLDDEIEYLSTFAFKSRRKILLLHCEHDGGDHRSREALKSAVDKADLVAVVSKHKIASMRDIGLSDKIVELPFGVERWDLPPEKRDPKLVGCWHNAPNDEIRSFWKPCVAGFNSVMIGPVVSGDFPLHITNGYQSFVEAASRVGVYLNCVVGEAMGMAPMEAMAAGIPVITGCAPEPWEFMFSGWNGFLSRKDPMSSVEWIRERIRYLVNNPTDAARMGEAGRQTVLRRFPLSRVRETFESFLQ